jgi:UDP-glucose 4-epimerase
MRIIVTGGAGFVGSHIVVDDLSTGRRKNVHPEARLVEMDIGDPGLVDLFATEKPDLVNHHAANASVSRLVREPLFDAGQNVLGTLNVLEAARHSYLDCGKIERELGWKAGAGLRERLERTWKHFTQPR